MEDLEQLNFDEYSDIEDLEEHTQVEELVDIVEENITNVEQNFDEKEILKNHGILPSGFINTYGQNFTIKQYLTNPAIARDHEINQLILIMITPYKSGLLIGLPGIGKTAIVEGLAYKIQNNLVPEVLLGYQIISINSSSLLGTMTVNGVEELKVQVLVNELQKCDRVILFIDEIHTLIGDKTKDAMDLANILKPALDRGSIKTIGATTTDEYERYLVKDKAFIRRFEKVNVEEPNMDAVVKIMMGTLPRIEKTYGIKLRYTDFINEQIMRWITEATSEYKREYILSSRYPDISLTILSRAFSYALFENKKYVDLEDIYKSYTTSKAVYLDVIEKEKIIFKEKFERILREDQIILKENYTLL